LQLHADMMTQAQIKGYTLAMAATLAGSTVYIFSKAAFEYVSLCQFGMYWFGLGMLWNVLFAIVVHNKEKQLFINKRIVKPLFVIGIMELVATIALYSAIISATDASIPSFLRNMEYVFITFFGVLMLKERFVFSEIAGILLVFTGVFIISYTPDVNFLAFMSGTTGLMFISAVFYASRTILAKRNIKRLTPSILATNRVVFLLTASVIALIVQKQSVFIGWEALAYIAAGSFLGPFITSVCQFGFLKYIEASRGAIIQSTTGLFVLAGSYLFLGSLPLRYQIIGGLVSIVGAVLLIMGSRIKYSKFLQK